MGAAGVNDWKPRPKDVAQVVIDLVSRTAKPAEPRRARPSKPPRK
jgi:hypothetical protein